MKFLIIIPTLNENKNIRIIHKKIIKIFAAANILLSMIILLMDLKRR